MPSKPSRSRGELTTRPHPPEQGTVAGEPGIHALDLGDEIRDGRLFIPRGGQDRARPLILLLHGAGADGSNMLRMIGKAAAENDCIILAPDARKHTWDVLIGGFGPDVSFIDRALRHTFDRCWVDPSRLAIGGFSDGASYALTLGLANGDLFTHVIAYSPGFMRPPRVTGSPRIFVSHGTEDAVLPIQVCSRRIVPQLEEAKYDVTYQEFTGPHTVPDEVLSASLVWFLQSAAWNGACI